MGTLWLVMAAACGLAVGLVYFGALWLTVRRLPRARSPALWVAVSLLTRLAVAMAVFYIVMAGEWLRVLACLVGFLAARAVLLRQLTGEAWPPRPLAATRR